MEATQKLLLILLHSTPFDDLICWLLTNCKEEFVLFYGPLICQEADDTRNQNKLGTHCFFHCTPLLHVQISDE